MFLRLESELEFVVVAGTGCEPELELELAGEVKMGCVDRLSNQASGEFEEPMACSTGRPRLQMVASWDVESLFSKASDIECLSV